MSSHDKGHVERVVKIARYIAEKEGAMLDVVLKAAELHDIARDCPNHAEKSAKIARELLKGYDAEFVDAVCHAIEAHSFSGSVRPKTLEAKILSDADKLDAMGAVGVARAFLFSGEKGRNVEETLIHFEEKLLKLKDMLYTETAREIARERHKFLEEFYRQIKKELNEFESK
ncbi:HD domain-containing protein [Archaeoglobus sp.]